MQNKDFKGELRRLLEGMIFHTTHEKDCIHCKNLLDQTLSQIISLVEGIVPEEKKEYGQCDCPEARVIFESENYCRGCGGKIEDEDKGFNACRQEILGRIDDGKA